jgi:hypothetical protein
MPNDTIDTADLDGSREALHTEVQSLAAASSARAETARRATEADLAADADAQRLRTAAPLLFEAHSAYLERAATIAADRTLSDEGRQLQLADAAKERDAAEERISKHGLADPAARLLARHPQAGLRTMAADEAATASLFFAAAPVQLPSQTLADAARYLHVAQATTDVTEANRVNRLLAAAVLPVVERFAKSPPRHAQKFAPIAADLAAAITTHLATASGDIARNVVTTFTQRVTAEAEGLRLLARSGGRGFDSLVARVAAPSATWEADNG